MKTVGYHLLSACAMTPIFLASGLSVEAPFWRWLLLGAAIGVFAALDKALDKAFENSNP